MGKKVMLVDDATFMRLKLKAILTEFGHEVIGEASTGRIAIDQYRSLKPEVVLMDITMPDMNGLDALREIKKIDPQATIVMVSAMGSQEFVLDAIRAGARGYLLKTVDAEELIAAVEAVHRGAYLIDPLIAARVLSELHLGVPELPRVEPLTEGEMAVLRLVAQGVDNQGIAQTLHYSVYTVSNRLRTIYAKLHVTNRTQAALYALRRGLVDINNAMATSEEAGEEVAVVEE